MPTDLTRLKVSLTKFGANKIAALLKEFDKDDILNHVYGDFNDIKIDRAQVKRILSIDDSGVAPEIWNDIKKFGEEDVFDLVFFAIVLSHHKLMATMIDGFKNNAVIRRGDVIQGKVYTNFARIIEDLGFSVEHTPEFVSFDISRIFYKFYLSPFIYKLLTIKLIEAGWELDVELIEEAIRLDLHKVFGLNKQDFQFWLDGNVIEDEIFLEKTKAKRKFKTGIKFVPGHNRKYEGSVEYEVNPKGARVLLHNKIQNHLFHKLNELFPDDEIGTEIKTNIGSVDIVKKSGSSYVFYEIKTAKTIRICIRQALSQLLEYGYWNDIVAIDKLIIISPLKPTKSSNSYLLKLRNLFNIPVYYQQFDVDTNTLSEMN